MEFFAFLLELKNYWIVFDLLIIVRIDDFISHVFVFSQNSIDAISKGLFNRVFAAEVEAIEQPSKRDGVNRG